MILNVVSGSGGAELNFDVVGGTSAPSSATENTIWVNTSTSISSWLFSPTQPSNPSSGMVWIQVGSSSGVAFNALKSNGFQMYPMSAMQYISGSWVSKTAKTYQGGKWVDWWAGQLYENGNEHTNVTGGWMSEGKNYESSSDADALAPTITRESNYIQFALTEYQKSGIARTTKAIDLSGYSKIVMTGDFYNGDKYENMLQAMVWTSIGTYYMQNVVVVKELAVRTHISTIEIDISSISTSCYIGFSINTANSSSANSYVKLESCYLVR